MNSSFDISDNRELKGVIISTILLTLISIVSTARDQVKPNILVIWRNDIDKKVIRFFVGIGLVISAMLLFVEASMAQNTNLQRENVDSDSFGDTIKQQPVEHPLEPGKVIDDIVPKPGSIFNVGVPQSYFDWKEELYNKIGLKFEVSYQLLFQAASDVAPEATYDQALGQWWGFLTK